MHYLTKVLLGPEALRQFSLRDAYSLHRLVYSWFPISPDNTQDGTRFLYADLGPTRDGRTILLLSEKEPTLPSFIPSASTTLGDNFFSFTDFRFQVDLNPVRKDKADGKRRPVMGQLNLLNWFIAQAPKWGFLADATSLEARICPTRTFDKGPTKCTFHHVRFRGSLRVTDPQLFQKAVFNGLGHGKAFGFGLLQLIPIEKSC